MAEQIPPLEYPDAERIPAALAGPSSSLEGLRILVTGLGVSGFPAAVHLAERGAAVTVVDGDAERDETERERILSVFDVDIRRGPEHVAGLPPLAGDAAFDLVVTSPGWRPDSPVLAGARAAGIPVIGEVELAWRVRGTNDARWLVVTGTNGKTTTTTMLASMLTAAGLRARACGNIGDPLLEAVLDPELEVLAIELSSFQLHWELSMGAHAAVVLNLADDHLDWHGGADAYRADKGRAYHGVHRACVYNVDDPATRALVEQAEVVAGARAVGFTLGTPGPGEFGLVEDLLVDRAFIPARYSAAAEIADLADVGAAVGTDAPGPHHIADALAAAALARSVGVEPSAVREGLRQHAPGAHRSAVVAEAAGVTWVDDSKATNPHAAAAALAARDSVVWIAGGLLKGADVSALVAEAAARLRGVVLIGEDRGALRAALAQHAPDVPVREVDLAADVSAGLSAQRRGAPVMEAAVAAAGELAGFGDAVLLAPAAASMDQFLSYATRGDLFTEAAQAWAAAHGAAETDRARPAAETDAP
ncbi:MULTISPECIES: UDP-N-acetylmuramoyl-L-alanine--D-glutamate ligase [Brevibacterium]|uniref:UDP-N-acetylmuramoylalanine--D-glutamate ligase n=1 Tax=Brevibacterium salitolerans TaxID=1403566 RepID=A0ABP5IU62_9MICO|nr:UDP-N-acetylmuramoyl-L-alanine--D-glutamate ligase [Brevibacterium sp.]